MHAARPHFVMAGCVPSACTKKTCSGARPRTHAQKQLASLATGRPQACRIVGSLLPLSPLQIMLQLGLDATIGVCSARPLDNKALGHQWRKDFGDLANPFSLPWTVHALCVSGLLCSALPPPPPHWKKTNNKPVYVAFRTTAV